MKSKSVREIEATIEERLSEIKAVPARDSHAASRGRAQFLSQAVSISESHRHKGWISIFRKEHFAMNTMIATLMILSLLFGGGATVRAAQDDLPNEPLYGLKLWSEGVGLQLQKTPEAKVERLMDLAQVRLQEMTQLVNTDQAVPDQLRLRLEDHLQQALQTCTTLDDPTLEQTLLQIRDRLQQQDRDMDQLQLHTADQDQLRLLTQTRSMLQDRLRLVDEGLLNHEMFRYRVQNGFQFGQDDELTPPAQNGNGQQNQNQNQNGGPTLSPNGPNTDPGGPNLEPGGPNINPGGPNPAPGGPNLEPTGPNPEPGNMNGTPGGPNTDPNGNTNGTGTQSGGKTK